MPVFISYSRNDEEFVKKLSSNLARKNTHIWIDSWEMNAGDSVRTNLEKAIKNSSALLVILSKSSVQSKWCKWELDIGLLQELSERRVIILPVLLEDCDIPESLRDKLFADFRYDFDAGFGNLIDAIAKITNPNQGRIIVKNYHRDWGIDWGVDKNNLFFMNFVIAEHSTELKFTSLVDIYLSCDNIITNKYIEHTKNNNEILGRISIAAMLEELGKDKEIFIGLDDSLPQKKDFIIQDKKLNSKCTVKITCRRLGEDIGKSNLINISNFLKEITKRMFEVAYREEKT